MTHEAPPGFSVSGLSDLLSRSRAQRRSLSAIYDRLPPTRCRRDTFCCSLLPEMTLIEMLSALRQFRDMPPADQKAVFRKIVRYFFTNPVEVSSCPFLEKKECRIYPGRFFGCRAYGLWSPEYYRKIADQNRSAKRFLQKQWQAMGIVLPQSVLDYQVPYCRNVTALDGSEVNDKDLLKISEEILRMSAAFPPWHEVFEQTYFSDLGFLITSLAFGIHEAIQMKLATVRDIVLRNDSKPLHRILDALPDGMFERLV